jgi:uncharacterized protein YqeY
MRDMDRIRSLTSIGDPALINLVKGFGAQNKTRLPPPYAGFLAPYCAECPQRSNTERNLNPMSSEILDRVLADIKTAMKAKDKDRLAALRFLHSEIKNVSINERRDVTDEDAISVVSKMIKQRQESIEQFREGGRDDLVASEEFQLNIYRAYQPEQLGEDEIAKLVDQAIADTGASGKADMGKVMKALMPLVKGKADGKLVSSIVNSKLG